ncbi:MAG: P27 family phage terminase small subunit [Planctomycetia bacterium]|nr:P27 family phage terminase small subunit [Planctomycetia bacterium]
MRIREVRTIPQAPAHLGARARKEWERVGALVEGDAQALAGYCVCYARFVAATKNVVRHGTVVLDPDGRPMKSPYLLVAESALDGMRRMLKRLTRRSAHGR